MTAKLLDAFSAAWSGTLPDTADAGAEQLREALSAALGRAEAAVDLEKFAGFVGARAPAELALSEALTAVFIDDLALVFAALAEQGPAVERVTSLIDAASKEVAGASGVEASELAQVVATRLLVADSEQRPRLGTYAGKAPLGAWLRSVAMRCAANLGRSAVREAPLDDRMLEVLGAGGGDPEGLLLREDSRAAFRAAFRQALSELAPDERTLLRMFVLEGVGMEALARMRGVHRTTVSRSLTDLRSRLRRHTEQVLERNLGMGRADVRSLIGVLHSQLDASFAALNDGPEE